MCVYDIKYTIYCNINMSTRQKNKSVFNFTNVEKTVEKIPSEFIDFVGKNIFFIHRSAEFAFLFALFAASITGIVVVSIATDTYTKQKWYGFAPFLVFFTIVAVHHFYNAYARKAASIKTAGHEKVTHEGLLFSNKLYTLVNFAGVISEISSGIVLLTTILMFCLYYTGLVYLHEMNMWISLIVYVLIKIVCIWTRTPQSE